MGRKHEATWTDFHGGAEEAGFDMALYRMVLWDKDSLSHELRDVVACNEPKTRKALLKDTQIAVDRSKFCDTVACDQMNIFALAHGETLRFVWVQPGVALVDVQLGDEGYVNSDGVFEDSFGDKIANIGLTEGSAGTIAGEVTVPTSGWYRIDLRAKPGVVIEPCLVRAP
jgi:hypothetical protein